MGTGTNLGRVRGLGSAGHGSHHWIMQRVTAVGNLILVLWFLITLAMMPSYDYDTMVAWLSSPLAAVPMILLLISVFWHLRMGLQVLMEDYVHDAGLKFGLTLLLNFYAIGGAALGIFAVAKIAFSGAAA
ncbi:succinate dehydrogenase, hydrophobic membrane anchor protein [Sphingorhabdus sp. Alg239-R122]|uniref:succinate dehydrogenase, hydrophobic membrane anchor protein n=1 Tax=Sphingorhabdus sp. Alg239-R122 TaxID=2305989 RepID=UPI0013DBE5C4|nr:succinate dehydrogenase, hydrophobic membrane anchor protein [Sphingorhabdus sp. Alg239-R122]